VNKEGNPTRAEVFKMPTKLTYVEEFGTRVTGVHNAIEVGVELEGERVWSKTVTPYFVWFREMSMDVPKPFYAQRIEIAIKKAQKIANKINNPAK